MNPYTELQQQLIEFQDENKQDGFPDLNRSLMTFHVNHKNSDPSFADRAFRLAFAYSMYGNSDVAIQLNKQLCYVLDLMAAAYAAANEGLDND
jgi:hypothetical protein